MKHLVNICQHFKGRVDDFVETSICNLEFEKIPLRISSHPSKTPILNAQSTRRDCWKERLKLYPPTSCHIYLLANT